MAPGGTPAPAEQSDGGLVQGDAAVEANFSGASVDVRFTDIVHPDTETPRDDMSWAGLRLNGGTFCGADIEGRLHGPAREEVGGVFERDRIIGAFGAKRQ